MGAMVSRNYWIVNYRLIWRRERRNCDLRWIGGVGWACCAVVNGLRVGMGGDETLVCIEGEECILTSEGILTVQKLTVCEYFLSSTSTTAN